MKVIEWILLSILFVVSIIAIVAIALYENAKKDDCKVFRMQLDRQPDNITPTQQEWEFKQYHKN